MWLKNNTAKAIIRHIVHIARHELRAQFDSPTAYIILSIFFLLWQFLFFQSVFLIGEASLTPLFDLLPWLLLFLVPALTMSLIAGERSRGTLELLKTAPVSEAEVILGKYLSVFGFLCVALLPAAVIAVVLSQFGNLDPGVFVAQYLAALGFGSILAAVGIVCSTLIKNQIAALLTSVAASFVLIITGLPIVTQSVPAVLTPFLERLSLLPHYESMARGVIDTRDVWYFFSVTGLFIFAAIYALIRERRSQTLTTQKFVAVALLIVVIGTNLFGNNIPGRLDLTDNERFTLSQATIEKLLSLQDPVAITLYRSATLPSQLQPIVREVSDTLRDYDRYGGSTITVRTVDPASSASSTQEAQQAGVQPIQFNVVGQGNFQVQQGYFGLVVETGSSSRAIPFLEDTSRLEYQLTSFIAELTLKQKPTVQFLTGHGERSPYRDYRTFVSELEKQYTVDTLRLTGATSSVPTETAAVIIAGPTADLATSTRDALTTYLREGGGVLALIDAVTINQQLFSVSQNTSNVTKWLRTLDIAVSPTIVYDVRQNESLQFSGNGPISYVLPYPYWVRAGTNETASLAKDIPSVVLPWSSAVNATNTDQAAVVSLTHTPLVSTTNAGGVHQAPFSLDPQQNWTKQALSPQTIALQSVGQAVASGTPRLITIGDADWLTDQMVQNAPENIAFGIAAVNWLTEQQSLAGIALRQQVPRTLTFKNETQIALVRFGTMTFSILALLSFGLYRYLRRRNLRHQHFSR